MSDQTAPAAESSESAPETITFNVKANNDTKFSLSLPTSTTVADVKKELASKADVPVERQRLIYSGRVMKDPDTLASYKVQSGHTIHLVKGAASNAAASAANAAGSQPLPRNLAAGSGTNPLAALTGARYAGHVPLPDPGVFGPDGGMGPPPDPETIAQAMSNPMLQAQMNEALRNPAFLDYIIQSNPMLQNMGPQARELMQSDMFRQMVTDPQIIRQMTRMAPGLGGLGGAGQNLFPAPGVTDNTPGSEGQQQQQQPQQGQQQANPNPFAALFGAGAIPPTPLGLFTPPPNPAGSPLAEGGQQQQQQPFQNPFLNPAMLQQLIDAQRGGAAGAAGSPPPVNPFAGLFGGLPPFPTSPPPPADTRPPEERYAEQLRQLNDMGFYDFDRNVEALRRSGGSVQGAVNQLLGG